MSFRLFWPAEAGIEIFETADETVVCRLITVVHDQDGFVRRLLTQILFYTLTETLRHRACVVVSAPGGVSCQILQVACVKSFN